VAHQCSSLQESALLASIPLVPAPPPSPRQLFYLLDTGRMSLEEFRLAMKANAEEIIGEMEEDHLNPVAAFMEQMLCRRAASKLLKRHEERLIREVLQALSELPDFAPARWLWNAAHPHIPLHAFFRSKREPVFRITTLEALPQVVTVIVEHRALAAGVMQEHRLKPGLQNVYSAPTEAGVIREEFLLRRDRRGQLGLERRRIVTA